MSAVAVLLFWLRPSSPVEDLRFRRLEGIRGHSLDLSAPRVSVFSARKKAITAG
jgi:hypothetical protein